MHKKSVDAAPWAGYGRDPCKNMPLIRMYHVLLCRCVFWVDYGDTDLQEPIHKSYSMQHPELIHIMLSNCDTKITAELWTATMSISLSAADFPFKAFSLKDLLKDCRLLLIKWVFCRYPRGQKSHNGIWAGYFTPKALEDKVKTQKKSLWIRWKKTSWKADIEHIKKKQLWSFVFWGI